MGTLVIQLPREQYARLKALAKRRHMSVNKLIEEFSTAALAEYDVEARFRARAARGNPARGLELLDKLDQLERPSSEHTPG